MRWKRRITLECCRGLTIKNWASKEHQELDEQVLLLRGELVPAEALPPILDFAVGDALLDIGFEP